MKIKKLIQGIIFAAYVFLPFEQCFTGQQSYNFCHETELIRAANKNALVAVNYGTLIDVNIESGTDWENITFEFSVYVYGVTRFRNMNYIDSLHFSKAKIIRDYQSHKKSIWRIPSENITNYSGQFTGNEIAAFENPFVYALFPTSFFKINRVKHNRAVTLKYLFKETGSITLHLRKLNGENIISVSKGKFVRQLCCLKLNDRELFRKINYYLI